MTKATLEEFRQGPDKELVFRCDCGDTHFMCFSYLHIKPFKGDPENLLEATIIDEYRRPESLWDALKMIWHVFRDAKDHRTSISLNREDLAMVGEWCEHVLATSDPAEYWDK